MKKRIFLLSIIMILLCGCGQEFDVTVYNKSGITFSGTTDPTWIAINSSLKNVDGTDITFFPSGVALSEADVNPTNSVTFKAKENQTLSIHANGNEYTYDSNGNTSGIKTFEIKTIEQVLYGEFLSEPHWYAAVYKDNVIIYKK
ncbi:MAG TPA: hypothetical protein PLF61_03115 [Candidatus Goldiibacteriota bacterium]|nr:hypothetical protein [Candidatus Goldiibacteriota bacterium]